MTMIKEPIPHVSTVICIVVPIRRIVVSNGIAAKLFLYTQLCDERLTNLEFVCGPIFVLLLVNLRSGTRAKGSSNDSIICI